MTYESIKSFILVILVGSSIVLTWNLWTYQPNYEMLENTNIVEKVALSDKKETKEIVKADKIIFHIDDDYYGTTAEDSIEKIVSEMTRWNFDHFEDISQEIGDISTLTEKNEVVEIIYPGSISIDLYKSIFTVKDKDFPSFSFDTIVVNTKESDKEIGVIYFIARENQQVYRGLVPSSTIANFREKYFAQAKQYSRYFPVNTSQERTIYLPKSNMVIDSYEYLPKQLDSDKFKNALFSDPSLVQKNYTSTGEVYTDGSSLMKEYNDKNILEFVDPAEVKNKASDSDDLLKRSIDFVNEHGGWTDNYRFVGLDSDQKTVRFRLYEPNGYPVFSEESTMSEISLVWGKTDISRYVRSNFSLGLLTTTEKVKLKSGHEILNQIQKMDDYNPVLLEDITIGYEMKKDVELLLVYLEPAWYYLYDGQWKQLYPDVLGGPTNGLEQN